VPSTRHAPVSSTCKLPLRDVAFRPRRLGHANLFVANLERSVDFYSKVAGIELIRREPGIAAAFHSNGNTHHDVGLMQCSGGERRGIDGFVQPSSYRGQSPGLNHLGWELNSEADLIEAVRRAEAAGVRIVTYANHQISHSVYIPDPDGNYHEFYADVVEDWRTIFNLEREELVTEHWDWKKASPGKGPMHPPEDHRRVPGAVFNPRRISHATLVVHKYDDCLDFFETIAGLSIVDRTDGTAILRGCDSACDLVIISITRGLPAGLHGISFVIDDASTLDDSRRRAERLGIHVLGQFDAASKRSVVIRNADGLLVEFYTGHASLARPLNAHASTDELWAFAV
jgi:catechol 2,3-dioxygenase